MLTWIKGCVRVCADTCACVCRYLKLFRGYAPLLYIYFVSPTKLSEFSSKHVLDLAFCFQSCHLCSSLPPRKCNPSQTSEQASAWWSLSTSPTPRFFLRFQTSSVQWIPQSLHFWGSGGGPLLAIFLPVSHFRNRISTQQGAVCSGILQLLETVDGFLIARS